MTKLDASQVCCEVLTYKEGLLSAVAHDLKIDVTDVSVHVDPEAKTLEATFDPTSLRVRCAMKDGKEQPGTLSDKDKKEIESNIVKDVLVTKKHGAIRFRSESVSDEGGGYSIAGSLEIKGKKQTIRFDLEDRGSKLEAKVRLHQPDFGVKPYSTMLGTLKIKPEVDVVVRVDKKSLG